MGELLFKFFFGHAMRLARSQFPDQGLIPGHRSESPNHWTAREEQYRYLLYRAVIIHAKHLEQ